MILHVDMDAFYASVELRDHPEMIGKPVVVGGSPKGRGVVAAASYEARKFGVFSAMPASRAIQLCPNAVFIKPRMEHYANVSKQIREIFFRFTSLVEPLSLDEAFLDVSGSEKLFGDGPVIAAEIKRLIKSELGLTASAGVAPNKYLAKVASDLEKPDGLVVVPADGVLEFLDPLEISRVWGIGPKTAEKFAAIGVTTIGQLRDVSMKRLKGTFGINSEHFWRLSRGLDTREVVPDRIAKSVSHETTFSADIDDDEMLEAWLLELTEQVGRRLRRHGIYGKTIQLKLRYSNFETITRSRTICPASQSTEPLWQTARELLKTSRQMDRRSVRLLGMGVSNLSRNKKIQQSLFDQEETEKANRVDDAADLIRKKFGNASVKRGSSLAHGVQYRTDPRVEDES
jgi:DNA polymerase-4